MQAIDYKERLLVEIDDLPPDELEIIYNKKNATTLNPGLLLNGKRRRNTNEAG